MLSEFSHSWDRYVALLIAVVYVNHIVRCSVVISVHRAHASSIPLVDFPLLDDTYVICNRINTIKMRSQIIAIANDHNILCLILIGVSKFCSFPYAVRSFSNCRNSDFVATFRTKNNDGLSTYVTSTLHSEMSWKRKKRSNWELKIWKINLLSCSLFSILVVSVLDVVGNASLGCSSGTFSKISVNSVSLFKTLGHSPSLLI